MLDVRIALCAACVVATLGRAIAADTTSSPQPPIPDRPPFLEPAPSGPFVLPPVPPAEAAKPGPQHIRLKTVMFQGNRAVATAELESIAAPYIGRVLDAAQVEELRRNITLRYVERGYVNSGAVQVSGPFEDGVLVFRLVEGRVSRVQVHGQERLRQEYIVDRLVPDPGAPLNVNALRERFQMLVEDPLFSRINARLVPDASPGEAILDLDVVRARPYQMTAYVNNYRPPSIGANAVGVSAQMRDLTGLGDLLELDAQEPIEGGTTKHYMIGWRIPVNSLGTAVLTRIDQGRAVVKEAPLNVLNIASKLNSIDVGISHPIVQSLRHRFVVGVDYVDQKIDSTLLGEGFSFTPGVPAGQTRANEWRFFQDATYRSETNAGVLRSTFNFERNNNQAVGSPLEPPSSYQYWLGQAQYAHRLNDRGMQLVVKGALQRAQTNILPIDAISIGGVNSVRGYRENQLIRDNGQLLSAQLDVPLLPTTRAAQLTAGPFFDWGRGRNVGGESDELSSIGIASRYSWHGLRVDVAAAKRLAHPSSVDANKHGTLQDKGIHFQIA